MKNVQLLARKCRSRRELPAVMVKKAARRAENMADAIKFARCVQTGRGTGKPPMPKKNCREIGIVRLLLLAARFLRVLRGCSYSFPVAGKAVFASTLVCKVAFATYILTAKSKKSLARQ